MDGVTRLVSAFRASNVEQVELEMRIGTVRDGKFHAGVTKEVYDQIHADLSATATLQTSGIYQEIVDYHYTLAAGENVRTRVTTNTDTMAVECEHVQKCHRQQVVCRDGSEASTAVRMSVCDEVPVTNLPEHCLPTHVRIQQRQRFQDVRKNDTVWSYELSKTWSANTSTHAQYLQYTSSPVYEVELELVDRARNYTDALTDGQIADSCALKMRMMLGVDPEHPLHVDEDDPSVSARRKRQRKA
jgi:hypothetical protein